MKYQDEKGCMVCNECDRKQNCCNSSCFRDDEENIFKHLTDEELDYLVDKKQQIRY